MATEPNSISIGTKLIKVATDPYLMPIVTYKSKLATDLNAMLTVTNQTQLGDSWWLPMLYNVCLSGDINHIHRNTLFTWNCNIVFTEDHGHRWMYKGIWFGWHFSLLHGKYSTKCSINVKFTATALKMQANRTKQCSNHYSRCQWRHMEKMEWTNTDTEQQKRVQFILLVLSYACLFRVWYFHISTDVHSFIVK